MIKVRDKLIKLFSNKTAQYIALILMGIILLVFMIQMYGKACRENGYDFTSYLLSAETMLHGENPYKTDTPFPYIYPMFLSFILIPLTIIPYWLANLAWYAINVVSLFYTLKIIIVSLFKRPLIYWGEHLYVPITFIIILLLGVIQNNLLNGQVNFLVLLMCALFFKYFESGRYLLASIFLALGIAIKLVPLIILLYIVFRKKLHVALYSIMLAFLFCMLPYILLGGQIFDIYREYLNIFILDPLSTVGIAIHKSLLFTVNDFVAFLFPTLGNNTFIKLGSILVSITPVTILEIFMLRELKKRYNNIWIFCMYLLVILFISPMSETHHLAYIIPAVVIIILKIMFDYNSFTSKNWIMILAFIVSFYLGKLFKYSPGYFFSIIILVIMIFRLQNTQMKLKPDKSNYL